MFAIVICLMLLSLEDLYYKRIDRKQTTLSHNYTHIKKKKKKQNNYPYIQLQECAVDR